MRHKIQLTGLSFIICFLSFATALTSCSEDAVPAGITPSSEYFKIVGDTVIIPGDATSGTINVTADCGWSLAISGNNGWNDLHATPDHGEGDGIISITTSANELPSERKGELTIKTSDGITKKMHILQQPAKVILTINPNEVKFGRSGGSTVISVTSNTEWTVTGGTEQFTASPLSGKGNGEFTITAKENSTTTIQTATFTVRAGTITALLTVTQDIKDLLLDASPERTYFGSKAGVNIKKRLSVFCNDAWRAIKSDSWIHIDNEQGKSDDLSKSDVYITCDDNDSNLQRQGTITLKCDTLEKTIFVIQSKFDVEFEVPTTNLAFRYEGGQEKEFTITSNAAWTARSSANWLTINPQSASPTDLSQTMVKVTCTQANTTGAKRTATITVTCRDLTHTIEVEQGSAPTDYYLDVRPSSLPEIPSEGATTTFTVSSNDTWQVFGETDWCHLNSSTSVTGNGSVTLTVDANTATEPRTTTISFYSENVDPVFVNVTQAGYVEPKQPVLSNFVVMDSLGYTARVRATYTSTLPVTEYGFVYAAHPSPTTSDYKVSFTPSAGSELSGYMEALLENLTFTKDSIFVRAYAINSGGTGYSDVKSIWPQGYGPDQNDNGTPTLARRKKD